MKWNEYFELIIDWKKLPAYKAEPRIDSLIGYYLPKLIESYLNIGTVGVIPELPIRLATIKPKHEGTNYADRSYKVDFLIIANNDHNYLVEFKTDSASRRDEQDLYLLEAKSAGTKSIIEGIIQIAKVSSYKKKYGHLLQKLHIVGLVDGERQYTGVNPKFDIIYIQPSNPKGEPNVIDFLWISNWLNATYPDSEFEAEFAKALKHCAND